MGSGRVFAVAAVAGLVGSMVGCAHKAPPDKLCAASEDKVAGLVLDTAQRLTPADRAQAIDAELDRMRREHMLGFDTVAAVGESNGALRCTGRLRLHLDVDDQTAEDQATLGLRASGPGASSAGDAGPTGSGQTESGQSLAAGLASSSAAAQVAFVRQPGASPGVYTYAVGDVGGLAARLVKIASDLSATHSAKAIPQAFSGQGSLSFNSLSPSALGPNPDDSGDNETDDTTPLPAFPH